MSFTVSWTPAAQQDLAAVWMAAADRNAVTSAAHTVDALLAVSPETRGNLRFDTVRTLTVPPLGVDFEVVEPDRIVYVLTAWDTTKGDSP
jgi:plasmid stabilization system protein ParE